jgi:Protein of unknown function (DUF1329)
MKTIGWFTSAIVLSLFLLAGPAHGASATIPPGTEITMQNWRHYRQFMPPGMVALFEGKYFWKMPPDVEMDVGKTIIHPLPANYRAATERYGSQTRAAKLPDGGYKLENYVAGQPFPNPSGPYKGWEILANLWYRYLPHLYVATGDNQAVICIQDRFHSINCQTNRLVARQLKHNTDPGVPMTDPQAGPMDFTEWVMLISPENLKYTTELMIYYTDLARPQDVYVFKPDLRRSLRLSSSARCSPAFGDLTADDERYGFSGNIASFKAKFLGEKKILALTDYNNDPSSFPKNWDMPLGFPKPSWGKWGLRDVDVIEVRKIPSRAAGYCYGKRIMYVDKQFYAPLWEELYDSNMKLWKITALFPRAAKVDGIGVVNDSGSMTEAWWDIHNEHASYPFFIPDRHGRDVLTGSEIPKGYDNVAKYSTPGGLSMIMR